MDEHWGLQCEQFHLGQDKDGCYVKYVKRSSKSLNSGIKQRKLRSKDIGHHVTNRGGDTDLLYALNWSPTYYSLLHRSAIYHV